MDFTFVPKEYRPIPFWSWNEKLEISETRDQVRRMDGAGMGGFFMHARGGLQIPYMGDEWFDNVTASIEESRSRGMYPWAYDENGWPSGFGAGAVNELGLEYQQKYLRMEKEETHKDTSICKCGEHYFYFDVNPYYVDVLDKKVVAKFIEVAYKPYYDRYGKAIEGFFTDEPSVSRNNIPWSFVFPEEYQKRYGQSLYEHLEELFLEQGAYARTRIQFWKMVTELFSEAYMKQIHDQCKAWGLNLTGHLLLEESFWTQLTCNGACMPHYEFFDIPGMDWLGRNIYKCLTPLQVSSVAEQLDKEGVLSETFALCGHNVSFAELKGIYEWQMVHGINLLCPHLEGYSNRGIRKRDYPPAMYIQQPWWQVYDKLVEALSREGMLLSKGEKRVNVLLLHPQTTAWSLFNNRDAEPLEELQSRFLSVMDVLERKHIQFHLGDEIILERYGKVVGNQLVVGKQRYDYVIRTCCDVLLPNTERLLADYIAAEGKLVVAEDLPENDVIDHPEITYTRRFFDKFTLHYFVNTSPEEKEAFVKVTGQALDIYSGKTQLFAGRHRFEPWGSLMVLEDSQAVTPVDMVLPLEDIVTLEETAAVAEPIQNCLTLDRCDYYFDGVLQESNGYVLNICERANKLERPVQIHQDYNVVLHYLPETLYLACETPEKFTITINGKVVEKKIAGYFRDKSFQTIDIAAHMQLGDNTISFDCDFMQPPEFYKNLRKAYFFEGERNKLVYDMEIEAIYLLGDFCVRTPGVFTQLDKKSVRYNGGFELEAPKTEVCLKNLEQQGYPFFCGEMVLDTQIDVVGENPVLQIDRKGINAVKVEMNGKEQWMLTNDKLPLASFAVQGRVPVRITLINNLRNLLGPHHLKEGESLEVGPWCFYKEVCIWENDPQWNDDYCFVETGV